MSKLETKLPKWIRNVGGVKPYVVDTDEFFKGVRGDDLGEKLATLEGRLRQEIQMAGSRWTSRAEAQGGTKSGTKIDRTPRIAQGLAVHLYEGDKLRTHYDTENANAQAELPVLELMQDHGIVLEQGAKIPYSRVDRSNIPQAAISALLASDANHLGIEYDDTEQRAEVVTNFTNYADTEGNSRIDEMYVKLRDSNGDVTGVVQLYGVMNSSNLARSEPKLWQGATLPAIDEFGVEFSRFVSRIRSGEGDTDAGVPLSYEEAVELINLNGSTPNSVEATVSTLDTIVSVRGFMGDITRVAIAPKREGKLNGTWKKSYDGGSRALYDLVTRRSETEPVRLVETDTGTLHYLGLVKTEDQITSICQGIIQEMTTNLGNFTLPQEQRERTYGLELIDLNEETLKEDSDGLYIEIGAQGNRHIMYLAGLGIEETQRELLLGKQIAMVISDLSLREGDSFEYLFTPSRTYGREIDISLTVPGATDDTYQGRESLIDGIWVMKDVKYGHHTIEDGLPNLTRRLDEIVSDVRIEEVDGLIRNPVTNMLVYEPGDTGEAALVNAVDAGLRAGRDAWRRAARDQAQPDKRAQAQSAKESGVRKTWKGLRRLLTTPLTELREGKEEQKKGAEKSSPSSGQGYETLIVGYTTDLEHLEHGFPAELMPNASAVERATMRAWLSRSFGRVERSQAIAMGVKENLYGPNGLWMAELTGNELPDRILADDRMDNFRAGGTYRVGVVTIPNPYIGTDKETSHREDQLRTILSRTRGVDFAGEERLAKLYSMGESDAFTSVAYATVDAAEQAVPRAHQVFELLRDLQGVQRYASRGVRSAPDEEHRVTRKVMNVDTFRFGIAQQSYKRRA